MREIRTSVALLPAIRKQYASAATAAGVLLKDVHALALRAFLAYRLDALTRGEAIRHYVATRAASSLIVSLPADLVDSARTAADEDNVSLRQFLHTAFVWYADQLPTSPDRTR